jgi:RHS repeat-associated protein
MTTASFTYDPLGRRVSKTIGGSTTSYLYDGQNPVQELAGTTPTANLLTGLGIDQYLTRTDSVGTRSFLTDALGSSVALADNSGTVQAQYTYEPFGKTTTTGATSTNSFQYTGRENDSLGLYYYRTRYYNPSQQRFISEDRLLQPFAILRVRNLLRLAMGNQGLLNAYSYVFNNPLLLTDPFGLMPSYPYPDPGTGGGRKDPAPPAPSDEPPEPDKTPQQPPRKVCQLDDGTLYDCEVPYGWSGAIGGNPSTGFQYTR